MTAWRVAKSLDKLLAEVNARFPNRPKGSDGDIGDADHSSRDSDHNPWVDDPASPVNVVTARDFTEGTAPGVPEIADFIVNTLVRRKDKRVKYLICDGRIWRSYDKPGIPAWTSVPYSGVNAHTKHCHVSVLADKALYDSTAGWGIYPPPKPPPYRYTHLPLKLGARNVDVAHMQKRLIALHFLAPKNQAGKSNVDGDFGRLTLAALKAWEKAKRRTVNGVLDAADARVLG